MNPPPDLSDPEKRSAYRRELRTVARKTRYAGIALALAGAGFAIASKRVEDPVMLRLLAILTITAGGGLLILGMARRAIHHSLRMDAGRSALDPNDQ